ncbi:MAG: hypothetical protein C4K48_11130 [Candidatus Thorarchaeota archaeon]|nr:MAG: hypothetical protein C4K48_11130 [Candidatus Thorarchaeota archaeon]
MNEYAVLVKLLTRTGTPIGASIDDMLDALGLPEDVGRHVLFQKLSDLHERVRPLGLVIKHNPISGVFYLDTSSEVRLPQDGTTLPDRLAATLLIVMTLAYQDGGWVNVERVREFRKKALQGVMVDLRELQSQGYVELDQDRKRVRLGTKVPFEIDYEAFFKDLAESQ